MTTTGGPERSLADPAANEHAADDPVVLDRDPGPLDGDDIVIEPDPQSPSRPRRTRLLVISAIVAVLVVGGIALALASRDDGSAAKLSASAPASPPASQPNRPNSDAVVKPAPATVDHTKPVAIGTPKPAVTTPRVVNPQAPVASPPVASPPVVSSPTVAPLVATPPPPPGAEPPASPTSVLVWQATPGSLTIKAGGHKAFVLRVFNPSNGTVTLPHPLSCAPELRGPKGATVGYGVCVEMAQLMAPNQKLTQGYTIYATDTADAIGKPLKPGNYTVNIEGLYKLPVTITER